jgi:hypothetical protein
MIIKFTPYEIAEQPSEKCFPRENLNFCNNHEFTIAMSKFYAKNYTSEDIHRIESVGARYISSAMVTFFLDNNLGFRIDDPFDLIRLLRRLDRLELLQKIPH